MFERRVMGGRIFKILNRLYFTCLMMIKKTTIGGVVFAIYYVISSFYFYCGYS